MTDELKQSVSKVKSGLLDEIFMCNNEISKIKNYEEMIKHNTKSVETLYKHI